MKRKVIKLGRATLVASLPSKWVEANSIEPGDEIDLEERGKDLVITTEKKAAKITREIDIKGLNTRIIAGILEAAYIAGVDEIVFFHEPMIPEYRTGKRVKTTEFLQKRIAPLIGVEVIEQTETRTRIKDLGGVSDEEMDNVLRRLFLLIKSMGEECLGAIKSNDQDALKSMPIRYDNIHKFNLYYLRSLNKKGYKDFRKTSVMYEIVSMLDMVPSVHKYIAAETLLFKRQYSKEAAGIFALVNDSFNKFYKLYYSFKPELTTEVTKDREEVWRRINSAKSRCSKEDTFLYGRLAVIILSIYHLLKSRFNLEF